MKPRTSMLSAFTLSSALFFGISANAADLPKEGTYSGTYSGVGTVKAVPIGKEHLLLSLDETGFQLSNGLFDHTTLHCWGLADFTKGVGQSHGYCVATDPGGDQLIGNFGDEKHTPDQKSWNGLMKWTGTGKYTGISTEGKYVVHSNEFRPLGDGTYVNYVTFQGSYKLP